MTTFTKQITDGNDDGGESGLGWDASSGIFAGDDGFGTALTGGVRFAGVTIPNGSTISSATLTVFSFAADGGGFTATAFGVAADNCAAFSVTPPSAQAKTSATATVPHGGASGTQYNVTVTSIVQEVLGRAGWSSGNALGFVITTNATGDIAIWHDAATGGTPASISITYTAGGGGGGAYTLTAAQGSASLAGQAATLRTARRLVSAQGSLSLNGQAAGFKVGRVITAAVGSVSLTGQAARLAKGRTLTAASGSIVLTGQSAAFKLGKRLNAQAGSITVTGGAVQLVGWFHVPFTTVTWAPVSSSSGAWTPLVPTSATWS